MQLYTQNFIWNSSRTVFDWLPEEFRRFFGQWFTKDEINAAAARAGVGTRAFYELKVFEKKPHGDPEDTGHTGAAKNRTVITMRGLEYEGWEPVSGPVYAVRNEFGHLRQRDIIFELLASRFPWVRQVWFKPSIYDISYGDRDTHEFYVATENGQTIYVPFRAFLDCDPAAIVERTTSYLEDFCRSDTNQKWKKEQLAFVDSNVWRKLKKKICAGKSS